MTTPPAGVPRPRGRRGGGRSGSGEALPVPDAEFGSYYGRPVLKAPVWGPGAPGYFFAGGVAAGAAVVAAGADLTGRPALRRAGRIGSATALLAGVLALVDDLGRPARFLYMLRVAKPTSPMSTGTWFLAAFGPAIGVAAVAELVPPAWRATWPGRRLGALARPAGLVAALTAPSIATYTAVLLTQTAAPGWNEARDHLPFVFAGSAAAGGGGLGMVCAPVSEAGPARTFAAIGAAAELVAARIMERPMEEVREVYHSGRAGALRRAAEAATAAGLLGAVTVAGRSRPAAVVSGLALVAGSALQRFGVFEAGVASTRDPRHVVAPQRRRVTRQAASAGQETGAGACG